MNKPLLILFLIAILFVATPASAHTFQTDGSITVLLHTNPDDDPIAGQPAAVLFQITDTANKFDSSKCDCSVTISRQNNILFTAPLLRVVGASIYDLTQAYTFQERGVHQITVNGKPKIAGEFQSFKVQHDLRIDRGGAPSSPENNNILFIISGLIVFAIVVGVGVYFKNKGRK